MHSHKNIFYTQKDLNTSLICLLTVLIISCTYCSEFQSLSEYYLLHLVDILRITSQCVSTMPLCFHFPFSACELTFLILQLIYECGSRFYYLCILLAQFTLHKTWSFPLRIFSVNVTKSAGNCRFGYIYWTNP